MVPTIAISAPKAPVTLASAYGVTGNPWAAAHRLVTKKMAAPESIIVWPCVHWPSPLALAEPGGVTTMLMWGSYCRGLGATYATVVIREGGTRTSWKVRDPELAIVPNSAGAMAGLLISPRRVLMCRAIGVT